MQNLIEDGIMDVVVENLTKSFGVQKAIDSVSFTARKGEVLGFLGPNGAGKTTTMKVMACFLFPDYGHVYFDKYSIHKHPGKIRQFIGYLPEHNPLYEDMNVIDFLAFVARLHAIPRYKIAPRVMEIIQLCGLEHEKHKNIRELSKGYRQRVGLAQALIHNPDVLILDEPTTGLDPNQTVEIRELIKQMGREKTVILSSHILTEIEHTCDRVLIINKGRIVANGTSEELENKADSSRLLKVCIAGSTDKETFQALEGIPEVENVRQAGNHAFNIRCKPDCNIEQSIFEVCVQNNWYINELTPVEKRLEDIFRQVTQN